jgi:hypothetical protein
MAIPGARGHGWAVGWADEHASGIGWLVGPGSDLFPLVFEESILQVIVSGIEVEEVTEARDTGAGEHAKDVTLVLGKLRWGRSAVGHEILVLEGLDTRKTEVGKLGARVEKDVNARQGKSSAVT